MLLAGNHHPVDISGESSERPLETWEWMLSSQERLCRDKRRTAMTKSQGIPAIRDSNQNEGDSQRNQGGMEQIKGEGQFEVTRSRPCVLLPLQ